MYCNVLQITQELSEWTVQTLKKGKTKLVCLGELSLILITKVPITIILCLVYTQGFAE